MEMCVCIQFTIIIIITVVSYSIAHHHATTEEFQKSILSRFLHWSHKFLIIHTNLYKLFCRKVVGEEWKKDVEKCLCGAEKRSRSESVAGRKIPCTFYDKIDSSCRWGCKKLDAIQTLQHYSPLFHASSMLNFIVFGRFTRIARPREHMHMLHRHTMIRSARISCAGIIFMLSIQRWELIRS